MIGTDWELRKSMVAAWPDDDYLLRIIIIISISSYWNHIIKKNNYYWIEIITWNDIIIRLERNYTTVCKLFVLDMNTWYHNFVKKKNKKKSL